MVSVLGMGCMRLPFKGSIDNIDYLEAEKVLTQALDSGINYFDTAYPYHGGKSEIFLGEFFRGEQRKKIYLATKLPVWKVEKTDDFDRLLGEQLQKLQTGYIDFYLLHALSSSTWEKVQKFTLIEKALEAKAQGIIGSLGFSFHDEYNVFEEIIFSHDEWDFCQIQYNYMNESFQAGTRGLKLAGSKKIPVIVMEPLLGGNLAVQPPEVQKFWSQSGKSPAQWGLLWLWNKKEVSIVLSGMNTVDQVRENSQAAEISKSFALTDEELGVFEEVKRAYHALKEFDCSGCSYCMPCPSGVDIPANLSLFTDFLMYRNRQNTKIRYRFMPDNSKAGQCVKCGVCESKCPQKLDIRNLLDRFREVVDF
ncbi:aldo/keto reductase [candidate division WOR-3 bacterium]|nr:aldo/keto reductase [candidate division WOR-3 bacterium]